MAGKYQLILFTLAFLFSSFCSVKEEPVWKSSVRKLEERFGLKQDEYALVVSVKDQRMFLIRDRKCVRVYPVSTAGEGIGNKKGSNKTPPGTHCIAEKIGTGAAAGQIFKSCVNTGRVAEIYRDATDSPEDLITTRIMRLKGMEPGINRGKGIDSYNRFIYIHGTPEEGLIGKAVSHGCIRMKNDDIIGLFSLIPEGTLIEITGGDKK